MSHPEISVLICTYNRADMLRDALNSVINQDSKGLPTFEIVVIDNASTDHTRAVIEQCANQRKAKVRYIYEAEPGIVPARNRAIREAQGEWLAWLDDDELAEPDWLIELFQFARHTGALCIGGAMRLDLTEQQRAELGPLGRAALRETETNWGGSARQCTKREKPGTCNLLLHRSVITTVGMFDPSMKGGGSDHDLLIRIRRAGIAIWYQPAAVVYHRIPAQRLTPAYFNWDALQSGAILAHFDWKYRGRLVSLGCFIARIGQALLVNAPLWMLARLRGDQLEAMVRKSLLHRAEGYCRTSFARLAPWLLSEEKLREQVNFRKGRLIGAPPASSAIDQPSVLDCQAASETENHVHAAGAVID